MFIQQQQFNLSPQKVKEPVQDNQESDAQQNSFGRVKFLRNLYFLAFLQVVFVTFITQKAATHKGFATWLTTYTWFTFWICLIGLLLIAIVTFFARKTVSSSPVNWVAYIFFTIFAAFFFGYLEAADSENSYYYYVFFMYHVLLLSLFVHVLFTKYELTFQNSSLFIFGAVFAVTLYYEITLPLAFFQIFVIAVVFIIFGFYLVWENETVISQKSLEWNQEDYVSGAIAIYFNVFTLFFAFAELVRQLVVKQRN